MSDDDERVPTRDLMEAYLKEAHLKEAYKDLKPAEPLSIGAMKEMADYVSIGRGLPHRRHSLFVPRSLEPEEPSPPPPLTAIGVMLVVEVINDLLESLTTVPGVSFFEIDQCKAKLEQAKAVLEGSGFPPVLRVTRSEAVEDDEALVEAMFEDDDPEGL